VVEQQGVSRSIEAVQRTRPGRGCMRTQELCRPFGTDSCSTPTPRPGLLSAVPSGLTLHPPATVRNFTSSFTRIFAWIANFQ